MRSTGRESSVLILMGLVLALGLPLCHLGDLGRHYSGLGPLMGGEVLWWCLFAAIIIYVLLVERRPFSSIGYLRPRITDIACGIGAAIVMFLGIGIIYQVVLPAFHVHIGRQLGTVIATPLWFRFLTVTRAAFVEETLFRGYGIERLGELTRSRWLAGLITWALFTIAHLSSWGWGQVAIAAFGGLVLTLLYLWRRNLTGNIIAHWMTDGAAFILLPLLTRHG